MRTKRDPAEVAEWYQKMRDLAETVRAMAPERREALAAEYGTITAEGHRLSPFNCVYVAAQAGRPLLQVGGFRQWQRVGRKVRKGETAIARMWTPKAKGKEPAADEWADEKESRGRGFILVPVFDVSQTEPLGAESEAA
jgi:hypothetical protein